MKTLDLSFISKEIQLHYTQEIAYLFKTSLIIKNNIIFDKNATKYDNANGKNKKCFVNNIFSCVDLFSSCGAVNGKLQGVLIVLMSLFSFPVALASKTMSKASI